MSGALPPSQYAFMACIRKTLLLLAYRYTNYKNGDSCTTKIQQDATVYQNFISYLYEAQACFGRHTTHHQEPKTALAASGFTYVEGCWTCSCWTLDSVQQLHVQQPSTYAKPEAASAVLGPWWWAVCRPKHVWASCKYEIKFWYTVASCWIFFVNYTMMHWSTDIKSTETHLLVLCHH